MAQEDTKQDYREPIIRAESGIAEYIRSLPQVSALLPVEMESGEIPVFSVSDESAANFIQSAIQKGLQQVVEVAFVRTLTDGVIKEGDKILADCLFQVTVTSPLILSNNAPLNTTSVASVIARSLWGKIFSDPFSSVMGISITGFSREQTESAFSTIVEVSARIRLF